MTSRRDGDVRADHEKWSRTHIIPGPIIIALSAAAAALAISIYLTVEHYTHAASLACPESATINCVKVTTSKWAVIAGIPVAVIGLLYFAAMTTLLAIPSQHRQLQALRVLGAAAGVAMVIYLVFVELFEVDAICLWCTAVHALTITMFAAIVWHTANRRP